MSSCHARTGSYVRARESTFQPCTRSTYEPILNPSSPMPYCWSNVAIPTVRRFFPILTIRRKFTHSMAVCSFNFCTAILLIDRPGWILCRTLHRRRSRESICIFYSGDDQARVCPDPVETFLFELIFLPWMAVEDICM